MEGFTKNIGNIKNALTQSSFVPFSKRFSKILKAQCLEVSESQDSTKRIEGSGIYINNFKEDIQSIYFKVLSPNKTIKFQLKSLRNQETKVFGWVLLY